MFEIQFPCTNCHKSNLQSISLIYSILNKDNIYFILKCPKKHCLTNGWCSGMIDSDSDIALTDKVNVKLRNIYVSASTSSPPEGLPLKYYLKYYLMNETIQLKTSSSLPKEFLKAYQEATNCFENKCYRACALMTRVILEEIIERKLKEKRVIPNIGESLADKIRQLSNQKIIFPELIPICDDIKEFGNQAAHEIKPVEPGPAETCLEFADILISLLYGENNIIYLDDKKNEQ